MGAQFSQFWADMEPGAVGGPAAPNVERFIWVAEGAAELTVDGRAESLRVGSYAWLPPGSSAVFGSSAGAKVLVIDKPYVRLTDTSPANAIVGHESTVESAPLLGDQDVQVQMLIPEAPAHDMAVNTMSFVVGATLPFVEVHSMEHGLLMLEGTMVYRLGDEWHHLQAGDVVYMAPYCPQWGVAYGKTPAKYLICKDWNRDPLLQP